MATSSSNQGAREIYGAVSVDAIDPSATTRSVRIADADGAQSDASILTVSSGTRIAVTEIMVCCDNANTGDVAVRIGFGASSVPAASSSGTNGVLFDHPGIAPGSGAVRGNGSGVIGKGADGEDVRLTCEDPAGGAVAVTFSYYTEAV